MWFYMNRMIQRPVFALAAGKNSVPSPSSPEPPVVRRAEHAPVVAEADLLDEALAWIISYIILILIIIYIIFILKHLPVFDSSRKCVSRGTFRKILNRSEPSSSTWWEIESWWFVKQNFLFFIPTDACLVCSWAGSLSSIVLLSGHLH